MLELRLEVRLLRRRRELVREARAERGRAGGERAHLLCIRRVLIVLALSLAGADPEDEADDDRDRDRDQADEPRERDDPRRWAHGPARPTRSLDPRQAPSTSRRLLRRRLVEELELELFAVVAVVCGHAAFAVIRSAQTVPRPPYGEEIRPGPPNQS